MKTFMIDIHPELKNVEVIVKNGKMFEEYLKSGKYGYFDFTTNEKDANRIKKFVVRKGDDKSSNRGNWYAHCNCYCWDLAVLCAGRFFRINTCNLYRRNEK